MVTTDWTTTYDFPDDDTPVDPALVRRIMEQIDADLWAACGVPVSAMAEQKPTTLNVDALVSAFASMSGAAKKAGDAFAAMGTALGSLVPFGVSDAISEELAAQAEAALIAREDAMFGLDIELEAHRDPKPEPLPGVRRIDFDD